MHTLKRSVQYQLDSNLLIKIEIEKPAIYDEDFYKINPVTFRAYICSTHNILIGVTDPANGYPLNYFIDDVCYFSDDKPFTKYIDKTPVDGRIALPSLKWYRFGPEVTVPLTWDGQRHILQLRVPPPDDWFLHRQVKFNFTFTLPKYRKPAPDPTNLKHIFDEETRTLSYSWDAVDPVLCSYTTLWRNVFDEDGNIITSDWLYIGDSPNIPPTLNTVSEVLPEGVGAVEWALINYAEEGNSKEIKQTITLSDAKVYCKINGVWKKTTPWVKVNGVWKKCTKTYIKVGSSWKRTIS